MVVGKEFWKIMVNHEQDSENAAIKGLFVNLTVLRRDKSTSIGKQNFNEFTIKVPTLQSLVSIHYAFEYTHCSLTSSYPGLMSSAISIL
jgi:hypothetical protein